MINVLQVPVNCTETSMECPDAYVQPTTFGYFILLGSIVISVTLVAVLLILSAYCDRQKRNHVEHSSLRIHRTQTTQLL